MLYRKPNSFAKIDRECECTYVRSAILNLLCALEPAASEKAMAPHSSTLAWQIPWMEEPGRLQSIGSLRTEWLHFRFLLSCIGQGNGNPLQWSCLENPRDGGAWWAAICGVAQSQTRLKWLSSSSSQYSCVENPTERGAWGAAVHRVAKSDSAEAT